MNSVTNETQATGHPRRWLALVVLSLALTMVVIDNTILAVAIPSIGKALHADETALQWITTSYSLVLAGLLLPLAVMSDRRGRKTLLIVGLAIFGVASTAAAFATTPAMLVCARGAMGVGGACAMPASLSVLNSVFAPADRGQALAIWSGVAGFASGAGPIVGGLLLARFWWGSVFLVNAPVAIVALVAAVAWVPQSSDPASPMVDRRSAVRWWGALTAVIVAVIEGPRQGWLSPVVIVATAAAAGLFVAFTRNERRSPGPLIERAAARDPRMRWGAASISALFFGAFGSQFVLTQWIQFSQRRSALEAGLLFVPNALATVVAALGNPRLVARFGHGRIVATGLGVLGAGGVLSAIAVVAGSLPAVAAGGLLIGAGIGTASASCVELIMSSASPERAGSAAGVNETLIEAAGATGIAVLGSVLAATGSYAWPLPVMAVVAFVTAVGATRALRGANSSINPATTA
ncbi:MAG: drug resistance transporter, EmrB/QacA subfamily [Actinomycetia bacterium]|nr:drug resistance transporter, EmrB/QacA subfamily [Actinomycetes bacterium]